MEFGNQSESKKTWVSRVLIALGVVALVVVVVGGGSAWHAHVNVNEAVMSPMEEVVADASLSEYPEFYISVDKDDAPAPKPSEEGELTVFEEQDGADADEQEKQLEALNDETGEGDDSDMLVEADNRAVCRRKYVGCLRACRVCRYISYNRCRGAGRYRRCHRSRRRVCSSPAPCRRRCAAKVRACGRVVVARGVIASMATGKVMDVRGGSTRRGAAVIQYPVHCGTNQRWNFITSPERGQYYIQSVKSKLFLDIFGGSKRNGARLIQWTPHGNGNQRFKLLKKRSGSMWIIAVHSGKALDVPGGSSRNLVQFIQWPKHGGANQQWLLVR